MRKIFNWSLNTFLILSPLFLFRDYKPDLARGLFFTIGSLILFFISFNMKPVREWKNYWVGLFAIWMLVRAFFSETLIGFEEWFNFWYAFAGFFYVLCGLLLMKTVYCYVEDIKKHLIPILVVLLINFPLIICQHFRYDFLWTRVARFNPVCGFFDLPQQLSQYSAMSIPVLYYISPALIIIPLLFMFLAREVSAFVAAGFGVSFFLWFRNKKRFVIILFIAISLLGLKNISYIKMKWYTRPIMWGKVAEAIFRRPYLGYGYQSFNDVIVGNKSKIGNYQNPGSFNDFLHTILEFGFPSFIFVFMFFKEYFIKFIRLRGKSFLLICLGSSVFTALINMFGQGLIRYASVSSTFLILLTLFIIQLEKEHGCYVSKYS